MPTILDWIIDYIINPIKRFPELFWLRFMTGIKTIADSTAWKEIPAKIAGTRKRQIEVPLPQAPTTPAKAKQILELAAMNEDLDYEDLIGNINAIELGSLGQMDIAPSLYLGLPGWSAARERVMGTYNAWFRFGVTPYLAQYWQEKFRPTIAGPSDLVRFALREVWIAERRKLLLEHYPAGKFDEFMSLHGFKKEFAEDYWAAHWILPPISQLNEMLYRKIINLSTWKDEVRYNDYVPYAIPWLEKIIYRPYTRVDIRRMWDMRTVTIEQVKENYLWLGYDDEHADGMTLWTKVYTALPDLLARWKNGWITLEQVKAELITLGMPEERAAELMETKVKKFQPERVAKERDLTKSEIVKGVKAEIITATLAVELLMDLGYEEWEAWYILAVNKVVGAGHPQGYWEMKRVTEAYKKAMGSPYKDVPEQLISMEREIKELKAEIKEKQEAGVTDADLGKLNVTLGTLEARYRKTMVQWEKSKPLLP